MKNKSALTQFIDLSMPLNSTTPAYPGDPKIEIKQIASLERHGWNDKRISMNTHCGTHVDAPAHFLEKGKTLDALSLHKFLGEGVLIDVRRKPIDTACLPKGNFKEKIVLFYTGQSKKSHENYYKCAKFVSEEVAHELVRRKVKAIGIDAFSPDTEPYPIHKILFPANILIIENLVNLKALLGKKFSMHYFPLKITGGDGAPCRAVAIITKKTSTNIQTANKK